MKIYHLLDESEAFSERNGGAISRWVANLLRGGDEIIICPDMDASWGFPSNRVIKLPHWNLTHPVHPVLYRMPWSLQRSFYRAIFQPIFQILKPGDILYTHNRPESAAVLSEASKEYGFKLVLHMHNSHLIRASKQQLSALDGSTLVFCSRFLLQEAQEALHGRFNHSHIIYNGADSEKYYPDSDRQSSVPHIIFTGRLVPYKGAHILIKAMKYLQQKGIQATCAIVGSSGFGKSRSTRYMRALSRLCPPNVQLKGYQSGTALANLLREADIFCCPSIWKDPFPLAPLEAMASGLPVVASDIGGLPETLAFGGGVLVPPNDPQALALALQPLIENSSYRRNLGKEALQAFHDHFLWENARLQYLSVIEAVSA